MAATIKIKNSSTAGAAPTSSDLVQGELAVNVTDKRLYTENASGTIVELGTNPSVPVTFPDGSASAPSLTNDGDTNTGLFFPAADTVGIATGGTERLRLDSSGNLGLGVTPSSWGTGYKAIEGDQDFLFAAKYPNIVQNAYYNGTNWIYKSNGYATQFLGVNGQQRWYTAASGTAGGTVSFTQAMTLDASGNLGVGTTSPTSVSNYKGITLNGTTGGLVDIASNGTVGLRLQCDTTYPGGALFTLTNQPMVFGTNGTERARIDSSGNLLVGTTDTGLTTGTGIKLKPAGQNSTTPGVSQVGSSSANTENTWHVYSTGAGAYRFYVGYGGTISATSTTITGISDQRLKENIRDLDDGLAKVMALQPRKFDWKEGKGKGIANDRGFIAQEFEQVFPDMIEQWMDEPPEGEEPYKAVNANLIPTLVKAIQELNDKFEAYKAAHP